MTNVRMTSAVFVLGIGLIETGSFRVAILISPQEYASPALEEKAPSACMTVRPKTVQPMIRYAKQAPGHLMSFLASVRRSVQDASTVRAPVICAFKDAANLKLMKTGFATYSKKCPSENPVR